jgi:hypothetical protein
MPMNNETETAVRVFAEASLYKFRLRHVPAGEIIASAPFLAPNLVEGTATSASTADGSPSLQFSFKPVEPCEDQTLARMHEIATSCDTTE